MSAALPVPADTDASDAVAKRYEALMRVALLGARTSVWGWNVETDQLDEHDGGAALLGYVPGETGATQDAWNRRIIHPDDVAENHAAYECHARGETPDYESEYRARAKDGSWRWLSERGRIVERTAAGVPRRVVGTLTDVTQRRLAELDALEMSERLGQIARHVPGIVFQFRLTSDGQGHYPYVSESSEQVLGVPAQVLMNDANAALRLVEREDRERVLASIKRSAATLQPWGCEFRLYRHDGPARWMTGTATPRRDTGGNVLWHGYVADTTHLRQLEEARRAAEVAGAASSAKTEFLSRMSHELRTPLNAVLGFAQLLDIDTHEPLTATQRKRVALIHDAGQHLLDMIGELLDMTRIEAGELALEPGVVDWMSLLLDCLEMLRPQAAAASVQLLLVGAGLVRPDRSMPEAAEWHVHADRTRLRQVVLNLLSNAIKYNHRGGSVRVSLAATPIDVTMAVIDNGVGIAPADLQNLFEPFNRGAHRRSGIEGTGIGLALTRRLVGLMNGRLEVQSSVGAGSTFSVTLPRSA